MIASPFGEGETMMNLKPYPDSACATPDAREMIAFEDEEALSKRQGDSFARSLHGCDRRVVGKRIFSDGIVCTHERLAPTPEAASDRVA